MRKSTTISTNQVMLIFQPRKNAFQYGLRLYSADTTKMTESIIRKSSLDGLSKKIKIIRRNAIKSRSVFTQKRMKMF